MTQNQLYCFGNQGRMNFKHMLICCNDRSFPNCLINLSSIGFIPQSATGCFVLSTLDPPLASVKSAVLTLICVQAK